MISNDKIVFDNRTYDYTDSWIYKNGKLYNITANGEHDSRKKAYRLAGNYILFIDSFPRASLPYSRYRIADKKTGRVYDAEVIKGISDEQRHIKELVEYLKQN